MPGGEMELLTSEVTRREAARDAYPLATYFHAKQSYSILAWREAGGETVITARHAPPRETRPITRSGATVTLQQPRLSDQGHLEYCTHAQAVAWERIVGCSVREPGEGEWRDVNYGPEGIPEVATNLRTTHQNVQVVRDGRSSEVKRAIVLWDKVGGGLGLSKAVADNLGHYTQALLEIARQPGQRSERERLLREDTADQLHRWAVAVAPQTMSPEQTPVITEYGGTTFRSQLEARWAAYFDRRGISWEYEPARFAGWTPDFRLVLNDDEAYAEVKPVTEFPMDVAQRMLNAGCDCDILILGQGPAAHLALRRQRRLGADGTHSVTSAAPVSVIAPRAEPPATERQTLCAARAQRTGTRQWPSPPDRSNPGPRRRGKWPSGPPRPAAAAGVWPERYRQIADGFGTAGKVSLRQLMC